MGFFVIAGVDEAGRGPLAGPVVSAAVVLKKNTRLPGLNDSKKLSEKQRNELFKVIIKKAEEYSITIVPPQVIDKINILNATRFANEQCIKNLKNNPDIVLCDGNDKQYFKNEFLNIIKGDQKVRSIAAASILAKVTRDEIMKKYSKIYPDYQFEKHKGYGTRKHREIIKEKGRCEIHRKSFKLKK